jgi:hypothetical protein
MEAHRTRPPVVENLMKERKSQPQASADDEPLDLESVPSEILNAVDALLRAVARSRRHGAAPSASTAAKAAESDPTSKTGTNKTH